jgi:hypothetical protein
MVEQARLLNLLVDQVNQDQPQDSDSILPPSQVPIDLRKEERTRRRNKRVLSEIYVSEWEITYKETHLREGKQCSDTGQTTQLSAGETHSQAERLEGERGRSSVSSRKISNEFPSPKNFHPTFATIVDNPGISYAIARIPSSRIRTSEQLRVITARSRFF